MQEFIGKRYKVIGLIGKGGMADVYLALDTILNREVAVKVLKEEMASDRVALERFAREARASACLMHPNIVEIYDIGSDGNKHYIVMEYIKGYTLKKLIDVRGAIPVKESVWLMKQLSLAILEAHKNGIIHRDVKSQNVLIKADGTVKMADFGIAQAVNEIQITHNDTILGSVHYLAPELTKGKGASMQSDIYSLGIVFFELLSSKVPFTGDSAVSIALQHVNKKMPSIRDINPDVPVAVENIITKACAKDVRNRYQNVALMIKDLNDCLKEEHKNDRLISFDEAVDDKANAELIKSLNKEKKKEKKEKFAIAGLSSIGLIAVVAIASIALLIILGLSGAFKKEVPSTTTIVPNIKNMTIQEAADALGRDLVIDYSSITRVMTDDVDEGLIISFEPAENSEVAKNSKITVVVSSGKWSYMPNIVDKSINEVKELLKGTTFNVTYVSKDIEGEPLKVISQSILPNEKYNANIKNDLVIEYVASKQVEIPISIKGMDIEEAKQYLQTQNVTAKLVEKGRDFFQGEETDKIGPMKVVRCNPNFGSIFVQDVDNYIEIYYYKEGEVTAQ